MAKIYTKNTWIDEVLGGGGIPLYDIDGGSIGNNVTIEQVETVSQAGSEFNASRMNNLENGADGLDSKVSHVLSEGYKLVPSVSSGNLTLALKDLDGSDFDSNNPLRMKLSDILAEITSALSVVKNAATNWCNLGNSGLSGAATYEQDLFAYLVNETGASAGVKLAFSRYPGGHVVGDFSSTTTNEKYLAGPTNYNATDKVQLIGRFNATLSAGAGYTWSIPATQVIVNHPIYTTRWMNAGFPLNNFTIGSAVWSHKYRLNYRSMDVQFEVVLDTTNITGSITGAILPFTTIINSATGAPMGVCNLLESGVGTYYGSIDASGAGGSTIRARYINTSGTYAILGAVNASAPFTWGANDEIDYNLSTLPI